MKNIYLMENTIQKYTWGSKTAIPELMGSETGHTEEPWAELWMGAHPKAPSVLEYNGNKISLFELIKKEPLKILGQKTAEEYNNTLPFLFKILAAANPLSIQAHPDKLRAKQGFDQENKLKISLNAFNRNYKDKNHKPECICALTVFHALNGFRKISTIVKLVDKICPADFRNQLNNLRNHKNPRGLKFFLSDLLTMDNDKKNISEAVHKAKKLANLPGSDGAYNWMIKLHKYYPYDIGIFFPLILNLIRLEPEQAMFIPAGQLHSYFQGLGIELMANSDNVLRGGLTDKYINVPELMKILDFNEMTPEIILPKKISQYEKIYNTQAEEFILSIITITKHEVYAQHDNTKVEILLCTEGEALVRDSHGKHGVPLLRGHSVLIPFCVKDYTITGNAKIYKASAPNAGKMK